MKCIFVAAALLCCGQPVLAFDFQPIKPMDTREVDAAMLKDMFGVYEIRDKAGKRRCRVVLTQRQAIGGYAVELGPDCAKAFPVMADIAGWRLLKNWTVDLIDPLRKTRVRFSTPDDRYVPSGNPADIAGMDELRKLPDAAAKPRR